MAITKPPQLAVTGAVRLKDISQAPAYLVFHDAFDHGAMDVYAASNLDSAKAEAEIRQQYLEQTGNDEGGYWRAYEKLPRVKVYAFRGQMPIRSS